MADVSPPPRPGAEKLERGDVAASVAALALAASNHERLIVDEPHAATSTHHFHLGAARLAIAKDRRATAEGGKRVIQRRFNAGVFEATSEIKASRL